MAIPKKFLFLFTVIILISSCLLFLPACKEETGNFTSDTGSITAASTISGIQQGAPETIQEQTQETPVIKTPGTLQEKLDRVESIYGPRLRQKIENIPDEKYRQAILDDDMAIEAINFFNNYGYSELLLAKKIALEEFGFVKLYGILKNYDKETVSDYIKNVTDARNDSAVAFIINNNIEDISAAFSAFIAQSHNIPYFIISYKDGSVIDEGTNKTLDENDISWQSKGIYQYLSIFMEELNSAKIYGQAENIEFDKTKAEILDYLDKFLKQNNCIYFFSNGHENSSSNLVLYSSKKVEELSASELYGAITSVKKDIIFKRVGNNCGDGFDINLDKYLANEENVSYSLLSSSKDKKNFSPNILDAIAFSMNYTGADPVTIEELKKLGWGEGKLGTYEFNKRTIDYFKTGFPGYLMEIDSGGPADLEPELRTNTDNESIFYIRLNYFK
jgi:hypothetical protein